MGDGKTRYDDYLAEELKNFEELAKFLRPSPGGIPRLDGIDIGGLFMPLYGVIGGDLVTYIDFSSRYDLPRRVERARSAGLTAVAEKLSLLHERAGILVADISGHRITDALIAAMLHQAFLLGAYYELDMFGEITTRLFEQLNQRFYRTTTINKYLTMIYGEISRQGTFRFLSAAHQPPAVFSREYGQFVTISPDRLVTLPPVAMFPSRADPDASNHPNLIGYKERYEVNEINLLAKGDILLLSTDGFAEHADGSFFPEKVRQLLAASDGSSASQICDRLRQAIIAAGEQTDDLSVVVIKKTG
ncbi:MAG TPA: PP2C family protein-serine/threonine phosphatase [Candidatus Polarisedimenticolaceae bacterium]|nr:PP2C family protein-serine/threonine phosphatase [Candidatus Polarisedimenticolaceae bacterium]